MREFHPDTNKLKLKQQMMSLPVHIDELYGNIFVNKSDRNVMQLNPELEKGKNPASFNDFLEYLKLYRLDSKNYCMTLMTKIKVMTGIMINLLKSIDNNLEFISKKYEIKAKKILQETCFLESEGITIKDISNQLLDLQKDIEYSRIDVRTRLKNTGDIPINNPCIKEQNVVFFIYTSSFSKLIRNMMKVPRTNESYVSLDSNCLLLEFYLLIIFQYTYFHITDNIQRILKIQKSVEAKLKLLLSSLEEIESFGVNFPSETTPRPNTRSFGNKSQPDDDRFLLKKLLDKPYSKFIKSRINLPHGVKLEDSHIEEYFEDKKYLLYFSKSFLVQKFIKCSCNSKDKKTTNAFIILDVGTF